jgi:hypothetical protein
LTQKKGFRSKGSKGAGYKRKLWKDVTNYDTIIKIMLSVTEIKEVSKGEAP